MLQTPPLWRSLPLMSSLHPPLSPGLGNSVPSWSPYYSFSILPATSDQGLPRA